MPSPLFTIASKVLRDAVVADFAATGVGKLFREAHQSYRSGSPSSQAMMRSLRRSRGLKPQQVYKELLGTDWGSLVSGVAKYAGAKGGAGDAMRAFLEGLGPPGKLLRTLGQALTGKGLPGGLPADFGAALRLIQAFGFEVLPPKPRRGQRLTERGIQAAQAFLESLGFTVAAPGEEPGRRVPEEFAGREPRRGRKTVDVPMAAGGSRRYPPDHPMVSGDFEPAPGSTNVHSYAYDVNTGQLFVRFLKARRQRAGGEMRAGPGSLYRYNNVEPELFDSLHKASSKGGWVWDNLRIRGTVSGHQKDYDLVGIVGGYVPRKATFTPAGEAFIGRSIRLRSGRWAKSRLKPELARPTKPLGPISPGMEHLFGVG